MLIYNFQKEFLGIDAKDLQELGFHDLSSLRSEVTDFADLFVKTPGYIHNFQHVHWIDFIDCADDGEIHKVIINTNGKNFTANIVLSYAYLTDNPSEKAYLVQLNNLRKLSENEIAQVHDDILLKEPQKKVAEIQQEQTPPYKEVNSQTKEFTQPSLLDENTLQDILPDTSILESQEIEIPQEIITQGTDNLNDTKLDIELHDKPLDIPTPEPIVTKTKITKTKVTQPKKDTFDNGYVYDPQVASKELGLPVDLIEEFIQDFIAQADDFKPELYASLEDGDVDNVKTLSHKLKGVAANLRVEDAFEVLSIINTTADLEVIRTNLELFYKIIMKLAGEEVEEVEETQETQEIEEIQEVEQNQQNPSELDLTFKDDSFIQETSAVNEGEDDLSLEFKDDEEELTLAFKDEAEPIQLHETQQEIPEVAYSKEKVANEIGIDITSFNELFHEYINEAENLLNEMYNAIEKNDHDLLQSEIIKLQGMSENMRVPLFKDTLEKLMEAGSQAESLQLIETAKMILTKLAKAGDK